MRRLRQHGFSYSTYLLLVFFLTVMVSLTVAVQVGIVLARLLFISRISALTVAELLPLGGCFGAGRCAISLNGLSILRFSEASGAIN